MVSVAAHAVTGQLRINLRSACLGVLVFFQHQHPRAFTDHKAVAILVPGAAGGGRGLAVRAARARGPAPPPASGLIVASAPPAIITSASPYSMMRADSPMQCVPVVQAETIARFGPFNQYITDRLPEIMLMMVPGMKNGEILRGPEARKSVWVSSIIGKPPIPEPMLTPMRSAFSSETSSPESLNASMPATRPR